MYEGGICGNTQPTKEICVQEITTLIYRPWLKHLKKQNDKPKERKGD